MRVKLIYLVSNKWGSPLEDDFGDEKGLLINNPNIKKLQQRQDVDSGAGEYEVNDYLDKLNVENKRKKELKDNADIVKKLKKRCEAIQKRVEDLGEKIKNRPQMLTEAISMSLKEMNFKNLRKTPSNKNAMLPKGYEDNNDKDSDSS